MSQTIDTTVPATRFAGFGRALAVVVTAGTLLAILMLLATALEPGRAPASTATGASGGDANLYAAVLGRLQHGEDYYAAAHAEMLAQGYGTRSVFNWRTPLYLSVVRLAGGAGIGQVVLALLALVAAAASVLWIRRTSGRQTALLLVVVLLLSLAAVVSPGTVYFSEIAAGVLILLSVAAYGLGRWPLGFAAGVAALFVRELAAVYVAIAIVVAVRERRWREVFAWGLSLVAYAAYFLWHMRMVFAQLGPTDPAYPDSWLQFGGFGFVLKTAQVDGLLFALPLWVTALMLPPALLGLLGWRSGGRAALTIAVYLATFMVIGKPFNNYWGAVYTPLLALGLAAFPAVARDLARAIRG